MNRKIVVNTNCYHGYSIEEALEGIHQAGFHYVELTATKGWTEHVLPAQSFAYLVGIKELLSQKGLIPVALSGHCNLMDHKRLEDFILNIELARFFGCNYIISSVGEAHLEDEAVVSEDELIQNIESLIPLLSQKGIQLCLEVHGDHGNGVVLKKITDRIHSQWVKINYDSGNAIFYGDIDPNLDLPHCINDVAYFHLKDKRGGKGVWDFPALGQGEIDIPHLIYLLNRHHNACPLSIEIEFTEKGSSSLEEVNSALRYSAEFLQSIGLCI